MNSIVKTILILVLDALLLVYSISNYSSGRIDFPVFIGSIALISYITISMVANLIREMKNKK